MNIRIAELSDLPSIVDIYNQAISAGTTGHTHPFTTESRKEWFLSHSERRPLFVAETGEKVMGWSNLADYRPGRQALQQTAEISYYVHLGFSRWAELPSVARLNNQDVDHAYYGLRLPP